MSRIGKKPILLDGTKVIAKDAKVFVEGPLGKLEIAVPRGISITLDSSRIILEKESFADGSIYGLFRSILQNAVTGVSKQWTKTLELVGVGFRAQTDGSQLTLSLGFSHPVTIKPVPGISFKVLENKIVVSGVDKYLVGETAASVRRIKPPEPYKGKGIRYLGEHIRKKLGKAAKVVGGAGTAK